MQDLGRHTGRSTGHGLGPQLAQCHEAVRDIGHALENRSNLGEVEAIGRLVHCGLHPIENGRRKWRSLVQVCEVPEPVDSDRRQAHILHSPTQQGRAQ